MSIITNIIDVSAIFLIRMLHNMLCVFALMFCTNCSIVDELLFYICRELNLLLMNLNNKSAQVSLLVMLAFIWGSSFILMKFGLRSYSNFQVAAFRIFISFVLFIPIFFLS